MARRPAPLSAGKVGRTIAQRLSRRVDGIRQLNTRFGLRARRVFLVWIQYSGAERGEGQPTCLRKVEILPTPRVTDASAVNFRSWSGGVMPEGSIRVDQISVAQYTTDILRGLRFASPYGEPSGELVGGTELEPELPPNVDFFYEIFEDARDDHPPQHERFRLLGQPWRSEGQIGFGVLLEASSSPLGRDGNSLYNSNDI